MQCAQLSITNPSSPAAIVSTVERNGPFTHTRCKRAQTQVMSGRQTETESDRKMVFFVLRNQKHTIIKFVVADAELSGSNGRSMDANSNAYIRLK